MPDPEFTFGPVELSQDDNPISESERNVYLGDRHIGHIVFMRPEYQNGYYTHCMSFRRKEFEQGVDMERANSYREIANILAYHHPRICEVVQNLG